MLINAKTLTGHKLHAIDGAFGKVEEFYFDDRNFSLRYLVAETGNWLTGRTILISPYALVTVDESEKSIVVNLTKAQIENSPALETDQPISRKYEEDYHEYYEWPTYWSGIEIGGYDSLFLKTASKKDDDCFSLNKMRDPHLISTEDMIGYQVEAKDSHEIGFVEDFVLDDSTWDIRNLIIKSARATLPNEVIVSSTDVERIDFEGSKLYLKIPIEKLKEYNKEKL